MSSRNHVERFGKLDDGLREDEVEDKIINWLEDTTSYSDLEKYETDISHPATIYGKPGIDSRNHGDNFVGIVDIAFAIGRGDFEHGVSVECKGQSTGNQNIDVMKHGIGQATIYDQSSHDSYLAVPLDIIDSRGIAAAKQANIGLIGVTDNSIEMVVSGGILLPFLSEIQYEAAAEYAVCEYCESELDTTPQQMEKYDYNFCGDACLEQWDAEQSA